MTESSAPQVRVGDGEVQIEIDGKQYTLRPSYYAAKTISSRYGGIMGALQRVGSVDVDVIVDVICIGVGYTQNKRAPDDFKEKIWQAGFTDATARLIERCASYLRLLSGGGRPLQESSDPPGAPPVG